MALKVPRIGKLDKLVYLEEKTSTEDSRGGRATSWVERRRVWAYVLPKSYTKALEGLQSTYNVAYEVIIRKNPIFPINPHEWRVRYNEKTITIHTILDMEEEGRFLKIIGYSKE